jgi:hypothetical protein
MNSISGSNGNSADDLAARLKVLTLAQVLRIDELLDSVGEYGEVHLVVQRKQLRYINQVQSYKADDGAPPKA